MEEQKETVDELKEYREQLANLTEEEKKKRDLYLKQLSDGTLQGPPTGKLSIDRQWLKYYDEEAIRADVPKVTALSYMKENAQKNLDGIALNFFGIKTTYKELFKQIETTAKALVKMGVKKDDVVVINSVTLPQAIFLLYALNKIGAVADLTDLRTDANGMKHYLNEGQSKFVFTLDACYKGFESVLSETSVEKVVFLNPTDTVPFIGKVLSGLKEKKSMSEEEIKAKKKSEQEIEDIIKNNDNIQSWQDFIKAGRNVQNVEEAPYEENKPLAIVHTSGTTKMPKSVVLTNENFNAMALQYSVSDFKYANGETLLNIIPMFVAYGVVNSLHMPLCLGMTNIVYPKVVGEDFTDIILQFKPNHVIAIPMHWEYLLKSDKLDGKDLSFLKTAACGGDKLNIELEKSLNEFLQAHNCKNHIVKGYGMTEVSACAITNTNQTSKIGSIGIPLAKNNVKIVDPDTKLEVSTGEKGEIYIETPTMMKEYLNNEKETEEVIKKHDDGRTYIQTGDLGHADSDGSIYIDGRIKRLIIRRGFKISAVSIEEVIMKDDRIENCAVVKAPDEIDGEIPYVYVVIKPQYRVMQNEILDNIRLLCQQELPEYYNPDKFDFVEQLPYTRNSKLDIIALENNAAEKCQENKTRRL